MTVVAVALVGAKDSRALANGSHGLVDGQTLLVGALDHNTVGAERWNPIGAFFGLFVLQNITQIRWGSSLGRFPIFFRRYPSGKRSETNPANTSYIFNEVGNTMLGSVGELSTSNGEVELVPLEQDAWLGGSSVSLIVQVWWEGLHRLLRLNGAVAVGIGHVVCCPE